MSPSISGKYRIDPSPVAVGSTGSVYCGVDTETGDVVAVKKYLTSHHQAHRRELESYRLLDGVPGIPRLRCSGLSDGCGVLVMDWFPADFGQIFQSIPESFTPGVVACIAEGVIEILERVHSRGLVHGDLKPHNIALTYASPDTAAIYLIDFGLSRKIKPSTNGGSANKRRRLFEGTPYFASIKALRGYEQSPRDDLESLAYVLIYFLCQGCLPWNCLMALSDEAQRPSQDFLSLLAQYKRSVCKNGKGLPSTYREFISHARSLAYGDIPDYDRFKRAFRQLAEAEETPQGR